MNRLFRAACFGTLITLLGSSLAGVCQQQHAPSRSATGTYRISGKIVDAHTRAALAHCSVQIADVKERGQTETVLSGDDGSFAFNGLQVGKYSLTAEHRGYLAQSYEEHDQYSTAIAVGPGLPSENLIFPIIAEGVLSGTITDESGEPVRNAQVRLFADQGADGVRSTREQHSATTDDRGVYELSEIRPGAYYLMVTGHPWYAQTSSNGTPQSQDGNQPLDVAYPPTFYPGTTEQEAATPIPVKGGDRLEADLTLNAQRAMHLRLNLPSGENKGGFAVMLTQSLFGQTENLPSQVNTTPEGSVELEGVLPGHYDVTVSRFDVSGANRDSSGVPEVRPETRHFEAEIAGGSTELSEGASIGEVTVSGKVISEAGKLPAAAGVSLLAPHTQQRHYDRLTAEGEFSLNVPPGIYEVVGNVPEMYIAGIRASGATLNGRMLTVKAGDSPHLDIVVGSGYGQIDGTALFGEKPASAVMVLLAPEDPKNNQVLFRRDQSDSDGTFSVLNIIPGKYRLLAIEKGWELEWANPAVLQAFLAKSVPVTVRAGDHLKQSIEVQRR